MEDEPRLIACPFCGELKHVTVCDDYSVRCLVCLAEGPLRGSAQEAVDAWNDRKGPVGRGEG